MQIRMQKRAFPDQDPFKAPHPGVECVKSLVPCAPDGKAPQIAIKVGTLIYRIKLFPGN